MRATDVQIQQVLNETVPKKPVEQLDEHALSLLEFTSSDLIKGVDWDFINMRKHYDEARRRGVRYVPYDSSNPQKGSNGQYIFFKSPLSPKSKKRGYQQDAWYQTIRMMDFKDAMEQMDLSFRDRVNLAVSGDLQVHCTGPAFNWWGYRYIVAQLDTGLYPQEIRPEVRNPSRRGTVCKHLATVLRVLPFWMSDINRDLRLQGYEKEEEQDRETQREPSEAPG